MLKNVLEVKKNNSEERSEFLRGQKKPIPTKSQKSFFKLKENF